MPNFEKTINQSAERRMQRAEEKDELSLSHYKGELHTHTGGHHSSPESPENILETKKQSCLLKLSLKTI